MSCRVGHCGHVVPVGVRCRHAVCGGALSSRGAGRSWVGVVVHVVGVVVKGVKMEVVGTDSASLLFVGVVCGWGEMMWLGPPSSVWWGRVSWVGRDGMEGTHLDDNNNYLLSCAVVVPHIS
jgi:hypothetical protein